MTQPNGNAGSVNACGEETPLASVVQPAPDAAVPGARLLEIYRGVEYLSIKHSSYFSTYETLFSPYVGKRFTFVEVGICTGGSLFMWRKYFGADVRIIGIDLNPAARKWEAHGFEVFIGNQADPAFWEDFYRQVGPVDILLDDGGHTNVQQVVTLRMASNVVRDGGLIVVEDTHSSYFPEFGNPSRYSFIEFAKRVVDHINARSPKVPPVLSSLGSTIASVTFFESIVAFRIDRRLCLISEPTTNSGVSDDAKDFRYDKSWTAALVEALNTKLRTTPLLWRLRPCLSTVLGLRARIESWRNRSLFR